LLPEPVTIRVGLVGYGLAGAVFHAPLIRACKRMELSAVQTSREAPNRIDNLEALLDRSDLVVIASPNITHFPIAKAALEAGKHVVVDKPFTVTLEEADELVRVAKERGRVLTAFHNRRWDSDFLTLKRILPRIGAISLYEAHWDRFRPTIKQGWRETDEAGGGVWYDLGPHLVDQALQLFGMPDSVSADIFAQRPGAKADDYFDVTLHYPSRRVCLRCSALVADPRPRMAAHGSEASFVKFGLDPQEPALKGGADPLDPDFGIDERTGTLTFPDGGSQSVPNERGDYLAFYEAVADSILEGAPVPVTPADARDGLLLISLARRASELGQRLPVPDASLTEASAPAG
jgi:scyllo-inositol 2-dehydrogenase (NADP+)